MFVFLVGRCHDFTFCAREKEMACFLFVVLAFSFVSHNKKKSSRFVSLHDDFFSLNALLKKKKEIYDILPASCGFILRFWPGATGLVRKRLL